MEGTFSVYLEGQTVGEVTVRREGLYYCFQARCRLKGEDVCRLTANGEKLGILVPVGEGFGLETKRPAKQFSGDWYFQVIPNRPVLEGRFIPIKPEEPFGYLNRLKDGYYCSRNGQPGIMINKNAGT